MKLTLSIISATIVGAGFLINGITTAQTPCLPKIDHAEVIQVVQQGLGVNPEVEPRLVGAPSPPGTKLVSGRALGIRLYVEPTSCDELSNVDAEFLVENSEGTIATSRSINGPITVQSAPWERGVEDSTLNITAFVPLPVSSQDIYLSAHVFDASGVVPAWPTPSQQLWESEPEFAEIKEPSILGVPVQVGDVVLATEEHEGARKADRRLRLALWPFSKAAGYGGYVFQSEARVIFEPEGVMTADEVDDMLFPELINHLCRNTEFSAHSVFGWVPSETLDDADFQGRASASLRAAMANSNPFNAEIGFAHENGHLYVGANHSGNDIDDVGWDPLHRFPLPAHGDIPSQYHGKRFVKPFHEVPSIMAADPGTITHWNSRSGYYQKVANRGTAFDSALPVACGGVDFVLPYPVQIPAPISTPPPPISTPIPLYLITGSIPLPTSEPSSLNRTYAFSRLAELDPGTTGDLLLRAKNAAGQTTYATRFASSPVTNTVFAVAVPGNAQTHSLELLRNGVLEDTIIRTANTPTVTVTSPISNTAITSTLTINWMASDPEGDELRTYIGLSKDGGLFWSSIASNISTTLTNTFTITSTGFPSGTLMLELLVSDGMNTSETVIGWLTVDDNQLPVLSIDSPVPGTTVQTDANLVLMGDALDREDGFLPNSAFTWKVGGSSLAVGKYVNVNSDTVGEPGVRTLSLVVVDSSGAVVTETVQITITSR